MKGSRVRRREARVDRDRDREDAGIQKVDGQVAEPAPREESRLPAYRLTGRVGELLRGQARQLLYVVQIHDGIGGNRRMAGSHHTVQMIGTEQRQTGNRTGRRGRRDLGVGLDRREAQPAQQRHCRGIAVE